MGVVTVVAVAIVVAVISDSQVSCDKYSGSLRLVNAVFRHGQRTPADTYPRDPHAKFEFQPFGWGQLTNEGKRQQYQLGQFLRGRYGEFLGEMFSNDRVRVQSTGVDRTLMSAQLVSAGLFPPVGYEKWRTELDWQPIPIHSQPLDQDTLLLVRVPCPRYYEELEAVRGSEKVAEHLGSLGDLYKPLSQLTGMAISDPDDVQSLYNTLLAESLFNLTLPEWVSEFYPEKMAAVTAYSFTLNVYNDELKKLKGGPLLKKILADSETKSKDTANKRKMFLYAGHDSTVANLMMTLKVWDEQIPVYNILALVELHQIDNIYGFKIFLRNSTEHEPYLLRVPGCGEFCPLDKLVEITQNVIPKDLAKECISHNHDYVPPPPSGP
uniref:Acid phosphatase n=1 Tax=Graphocephala atropunctata TaxID=36148 RepID=A0A1B6MG81_9HEMI